MLIVTIFHYALSSIPDKNKVDYLINQENSYVDGETSFNLGLYQSLYGISYHLI